MNEANYEIETAQLLGKIQGGVEQIEEHLRTLNGTAFEAHRFNSVCSEHSRSYCVSDAAVLTSSNER